MGTAGDWLSAIVWGGLWGAFMAFLEAPLQDAGLSRKERVLRLTLWAPMGLWFGIMTTFGWRRSFHSPLLFITVGLLVGTFVIARVSRKKSSISVADHS